MFYVKTTHKDGKESKTFITDDNVFCRCPSCGREVAVNLNESFGNEEFSLYQTHLLCDECFNKLVEEINA